MQDKSVRNYNFRVKLIDLMKQQGFNQSSLARATKLSQAVISKYILGKSEPGAHELSLLSSVLKTTMDELWHGLPDKNQKMAHDLEELKRSLNTIFRFISTSSEEV